MTSATLSLWTAADFSDNDREGTDIGSVMILANESIGVEKQLSLSPAALQEMVDGTFTNNGFILVADTELNDRFNYKSSDTTAASNRPKLVIQYTLNGATPTATASSTLSATPGPSAMPTQTATATPPPAAVFSQAAFVYDRAGKRVKSTITTDLGTTTTYFVGNYL